MKIESVKRGSQAERIGLRPSDKIVAVNRQTIHDHIDFMFAMDDERALLTVHRGMNEFTAVLDASEELGFEFEPMDILRCGNNCEFCFIDQNPPGMREQIYVKDEDYRLSFLHGAYITLADLTDDDLERIIAQRLSPLYISIHAADTNIRLKLLGRKKDDNLLKNMDILLDAGIVLHCQIVVCPGINDGDVLENTIWQLRRRYPGVASVAAVPVGLTRHRDALPFLQPVDAHNAVDVIRQVSQFQDKYRIETGSGFVYCADEWFIHAGIDIPPLEYYDNFPQIENGVGMVRDFLESVEKCDERLSGSVMRKGRYVLVTGRSMKPFIESFAECLAHYEDIDARVIAVDNDFYGHSVTVSGLLTGGDILKALDDLATDETVVLPPNCLNSSGLFLDDLSLEEMSCRLGVPVIQASYDPFELFV